MHLSRHTIIFFLLIHKHPLSSSSMNNMFSTRQTRSLKRNRRKSPRNPSPKRAKNSDSFNCTGCNGVFDSNRNLLYRLESSISNRYYMEDEYRLLPLDAIAGPAFCLPQLVLYVPQTFGALPFPWRWK